MIGNIYYKIANFKLLIQNRFVWKLRLFVSTALQAKIIFIFPKHIL